MNKKILIGLIVVCILMVLIGGYFILRQQEKENNLVSQTSQNVIPSKKFKILHIMSYHTPWDWTENQLNGFKDALKDLDVEYKVFEMDTKRKSSEEWKEEVGKQARDLIDTWKPDLVYTNDDNAQIYVAKYYINTSIPFVFSGVNAEPETYGFVGSTNNCGILEREHSVETVKLLKEIVPSIKKIAVISDIDPTWPPIIARMKNRFAKEMPEIEFVSWDVLKTYDEYKQKIKEYETKADAVVHLGDFTYVDKNGVNVPYTEAERWAVENSKLPDASFWEDRISIGGLLVGVAISGYEQGKGAGIMARKILVKGESPASLGFQPTYKGQPMISLARARSLGINVKSDLLLNAKIFDKFEWENK